jgi:hypothetical protein
MDKKFKVTFHKSLNNYEYSENIFKRTYNFYELKETIKSLIDNDKTDYMSLEYMIYVLNLWKEIGKDKYKNISFQYNEEYYKSENFNILNQYKSYCQSKK